MPIRNILAGGVMLTDISGWEEAARAHGECFAAVKPACTFVAVTAFINSEWLVEVEADCVSDDAG